MMNNNCLTIVCQLPDNRLTVVLKQRNELSFLFTTPSTLKFLYFYLL